MRVSAKLQNRVTSRSMQKATYGTRPMSVILGRSVVQNTHINLDISIVPGIITIVIDCLAKCDPKETVGALDVNET